MLDITVGTTTSESYWSLEDAEDFLTAILGTLKTDWTGLEDVQREYLMKLAAVIPVMTLPIRGRRANYGQALAFPRDYQTDKTIIPPEMQEAQALLAYEVIQPMLARDISGDQVDHTLVTSVSLGVLSVGFVETADRIPLGSFERLLRSQFAHIYLKFAKHIAPFRAWRIRTTREMLRDREATT